jgi:FtsZ-binding cell division protein ZapB
MVTFQKDNSKKKTIAEESLKTKKAREKLKRKFEDMDKKITPQALEKKSIEIHNWIARHADHRITLKEKSISLFDENQNAAKLSEKIAKIVEQICIT